MYYEATKKESQLQQRDGMVDKGTRRKFMGRVNSVRNLGKKEENVTRQEGAFGCL